jgi:hypothetical protein
LFRMIPRYYVIKALAFKLFTFIFNTWRALPANSDEAAGRLRRCRSMARQ